MTKAEEEKIRLMVQDELLGIISDAQESMGMKKDPRDGRRALEGLDDCSQQTINSLTMKHRDIVTMSIPFKCHRAAGRSNITVAARPFAARSVAIDHRPRAARHGLHRLGFRAVAALK